MRRALAPAIGAVNSAAVALPLEHRRLRSVELVARGLAASDAVQPTIEILLQIADWSRPSSLA